MMRSWVLLLLWALACDGGSATDPDSGRRRDAELPDSGEATDAGSDSGADGARDAGADAGFERDGGSEVDAAGTDAAASDAGTDAVVPMDASMGGGYRVGGSYRWASLPLRSASLAAMGATGGEGMQWPFDIDYAPSNPHRVYLVTDTSQVWRSSDGGTNWVRAATGMDAKGGLSLAVHPTDPNLVLVAGSVHLRGRHAEGIDGIWMTRNGGNSWTLQQDATFLRDHYGGDNFAFGTRANQVLCGTHGEGLLLSTDSGRTWTEVGALRSANITDVAARVRDEYLVAATTGLFRYVVGSGVTPLGGLPATPMNVEVDPENPARIWVTVPGHGVYRSTNAGATFSAATTGMGYRNVNWLEVSPADPDRLYTSMQLTGGNTIFWSDDGGDSWQRNRSIYSHADVSQNSGGFFFGTPFAASPTNGTRAIAMAAANILVRTNDGGDAWTYSGHGFTGSRVIEHGHDFEGHLRGEYTFFLVDFGVVRTDDDGESFRNLGAPQHRSRQTTHSGAVQPGSGGRTIVTAVGDYTEQRLTVSFDGGATWEQTPHLGSINFVKFLPGDSDVVFAGPYRSRDGGRSWTRISRTVFSMHPEGTAIYASDARTIYRSTNLGNSWEEAFARFPCTIAELGIQPGAPFTAFGLGEGCGVYRFTDGAWREIGETDGIPRDDVGSRDTRSIAFSPLDPNFVCVGRWAGYRAHTNGVFCSDDGGVRWHDFSYDLQMPFTPWSLAFHPDGRLFMGSSHGNFILE
ncbi:MAG: hypothetical protein AAGE52_18545 [Myxococcota bacterium]